MTPEQNSAIAFYIVTSWFSQAPSYAQSGARHEIEVTLKSARLDAARAMQERCALLMHRLHLDREVERERLADPGDRRTQLCASRAYLNAEAAIRALNPEGGQ